MLEHLEKCEINDQNNVENRSSRVHTPAPDFVDNNDILPEDYESLINADGAHDDSDNDDVPDDGDDLPSDDDLDLSNPEGSDAPSIQGRVSVSAKDRPKEKGEIGIKKQ